MRFMKYNRTQMTRIAYDNNHRESYLIISNPRHLRSNKMNQE
jgi:hypothetical protein